MGSEKIIKKIRSRAIVLIVLGLLLFLGTGFLAFCCLLAEAIPMVIMLGIFAIFGLVILILGIRNCNPKKSLFFKRNPDIFAQADELFNHIIYEDDFIVCSHKHFASKKNPLCIAAFDEVLGFYERTVTYNHLISVQHDLVFVTKKGELSISVYAKKKEVIEGLMNRIHQFCPEAKVGFSPQDLKQFRQIQKEYKKQRKQNS